MHSHNAPSQSIATLSVRAVTRRSGGRVSGQLAADVLANAIGRYSLLDQGIAITHGDGVVLDRLAVNRQAERGAHFVLATVAPANGAGFVIKDRGVWTQIGGEIVRERRQADLLYQWDCSGRDARTGMEP